LVGVEHPEKAQVFHYIATAKHCIEGIEKDSADGKVHIRVNNTAGGYSTIETSVKDWIGHSNDPNIDVAVLPFDASDNWDLAYVSTTQFATQAVMEGQGFGLGDEVFITGVFPNHCGTKKNIPIVRIGNVAGLPEEPVESKWSRQPMEAFIIDARSVGGMSGSPVFVHFGPGRAGRLRPGTEAFPGQMFYLLGLVHGHFVLPGVEYDFEETDSEGKKVDRHAGLSIVTPASKLLEVLQSPTLTSERERKIEDARAPYRGVPD
jgi:hypothetical protein